MCNNSLWIVRKDGCTKNSLLAYHMRGPVISKLNKEAISINNNQAYLFSSINMGFLFILVFLHLLYTLHNTEQQTKHAVN